MLLLQPQPPGLQALLVLLHQLVALEVAAPAQALQDLQQADLAEFILGQCLFLPSCVSTSKVLICRVHHTLVELVHQLPAALTGRRLL